MSQQESGHYDKTALLDDGFLTFAALGLLLDGSLITPRKGLINSKEVTLDESLYRVLVLCRKNRGRSQMVAAEMEAFRRHIAIDMPVAIISAGVETDPNSIGGKPDRVVRRRMNELHIDMSKKRVRQLSEELITPNTIVLMLANPELLPGYVFDAKLVLTQHITDPSLPGEPLSPSVSLSETMEETRHIAVSVIYKLAQSVSRSDFGIFEKYFRRLTLKSPVQQYLVEQTSKIKF